MNENELDEQIEYVEIMLYLNIILSIFRIEHVKPSKEVRIALRLLDRWIEHYTSVEEIKRFGAEENLKAEIQFIKAEMSK